MDRVRSRQDRPTTGASAGAGKQLGDTPGSPPDPSAQRHVLRFEVATDTFALCRDALNELRHRAETALADDSASLEMARVALGGHATKAERAMKSCSACVHNAAAASNRRMEGSCRSTLTSSGWPTSRL
jgi:hypothetical protein